MSSTVFFCANFKVTLLLAGHMVFKENSEMWPCAVQTFISLLLFIHFIHLSLFDQVAVFRVSRPEHLWA